MPFVRSPVPHESLLNHVVGLHEIQQGGHVIEGDLDIVFLSPVASTIPKWRTFKLLR
jgi:hypothetical protein